MDNHSVALTLGKSRLEALSDGVFAIAMTLLVLELKVPEASHHNSNEAMFEQLKALGPAFFAFFATFMISGIFWFMQHLTFHFIRHTDAVLCWMNLFILMFVSLLPFSAGLLSHFLTHPISQLFYFGNQMVLALLLNAHWHYAIHRKMIASDAPPRELRRITLRIGCLGLAFTGAFAGAFVNPNYSFMAMFAVMAIARIASRIYLRRV